MCCISQSKHFLRRKNMKKRVLSVFLVLCFVLTLLPTAFADSSTSGACGDNLTWTLDGDGTLTISGTGKMWDSDYYNDYDVPWADFLASIEKVVISKGVTSIGNEAFKWCERLTNVTIPDSFFDGVIGNVPFGDFKVSDKRYDKYNFLIHDYFFAKSLDKLRPGGVMALVTSKGTMDKENSNVCKFYVSRSVSLICFC